MRNYSSAFLGNHNLTNQNTDDIFRNRVAILSNMEVEGAVEVNFRESMTNKAYIDFLEMRAKVNSLVVIFVRTNICWDIYFRFDLLPDVIFVKNKNLKFN